MGQLQVIISYIHLLFLRLLVMIMALVKGDIILWGLGALNSLNTGSRSAVYMKKHHDCI